MNLDAGVLILVTVIGAATPLLLAALGELVVERSGVLNLGVEGMMLAGAVTAFATAITTGSSGLGVVTGALAGAALALIFAVLTMSLLANQVATGLALTIFGIGLSALIGSCFVGTPAERLPRLAIPGLSDLPVVGPLLFRHDFLVYFALFMTAAVAWFLTRTRAGMIVRAIGESHEAAHSIGYPVIRIRYLTILFGGVMGGLGGAFLSLSYTPMWVEEMTAGARRVLRLAAMASAARRLSVRRRHHPAAVRPGQRPVPPPGAAAVDAAVSDHHSGPDHHLGRALEGLAERAGLPRPAVSSHRLRPSIVIGRRPACLPS
jgi:ABC-type uncharacterized transport system permease subunit